MISKRLHHLSAVLDSQLQQFEAIPLANTAESDCYSSYRDRGPTLYVSGRKDSKVYDIPKEGKATVGYRVRSKSVNYRDDGTESYSTDIEVQTIEPTNLEAILGKYDLSDRARDNGGRFAPGQNVSDDDMANAYLKPKKKALLVGAGVAGLAAGAASPKGRAAIAGGIGRLMRHAV